MGDRGNDFQGDPNSDLMLFNVWFVFSRCLCGLYIREQVCIQAGPATSQTTMTESSSVGPWTPTMTATPSLMRDVRTTTASRVSYVSIQHRHYRSRRSFIFKLHKK